jgi:hypothetical protein
MNAEQTQDRIVQSLIQSSPVPLKADPAVRQATNGPALAFYMIGCRDCQQNMKSNWIRLSFTQGEEEKWESEAKERLAQHLAQFHT